MLCQESEVVSTHKLTLDDLKALPQTEFSTTTVWTTGTQKFLGVEMHTLLEKIGATQADIELVAMNDYMFKVHGNDFKSGEGLLAYERNGKPMSAREYGPLWIVYNYDSDARFRNEVIYARSVWQLEKMIISR